MKSTTNKLMIAAAILAVATGVASAATLKADVPFAFRAGGKVMPAGTYTVDIAGPNREIVILRNFEAKETALLIARNPEDPSNAWIEKGEPVLSFECTAGRCVLAKLWDGMWGPAYAFPYTIRRGDTRASVTEVPLVKATE